MKKIAFKVMNELDKYFDVTVVHGDSLGDYFRRVELTFIDGGHQYEEVKADFDHYYDKTTKYIMLHDTMLWPGCIKMRKQLERKYKTKTFSGSDLISGHWGIDKKDPSTGITVIKKGE